MNKHILTVAASGVVALSTALPTFATTGTGYNSALNQPSYWGAHCVKIDSGFGETYTAPAGATKVVVKGGTENKVYLSKDGALVNLTAATNPRNGQPYGISHVIVCTDGTTATTPTTGETSTTPSTSTPKCDDTKNNCKDDEKDDTPKTPKTPKEDKNQSACNPSDVNGAVKHRDDAKDCEKADSSDTEDDTDTTDETGNVAGTSTTKTDTPTTSNATATSEGGKGASETSKLPSTGIGVSGIVLPLLSGIATYAGAMMFIRRR